MLGPIDSGQPPGGSKRDNFQFEFYLLRKECLPQLVASQCLIESVQDILPIADEGDVIRKPRLT